ncbi:MAG: nitroreductase family deazaflavin-dependent oxidoreductase [Chloroflexota bacterium]|nr:nitroreductase family deazaflavin-dependent oxidoreductase [Chloroflexota bacterium]MDQ6906475.1 nitroreductase family deazaflavin-dependent oxidoreductase [Chloroflexota bacterium]
MPIPRGVARFNRRVTNHVTRRIAGWMPGFALLFHTGRRSGHAYRTPVNAFRGGNGYRIALTYGADSDWVRNVVAAGGCEIESQRRRIALTNPQIVSDPDRHWAPPVVRQVLGVIGASQYMQLTNADTTRN